MAKPQHIQQAQGYITPDRKETLTNQRILTDICHIIEEMLVEGRYGEVSLNLAVQDGILQNDITVTYKHRVRCRT